MEQGSPTVQAKRRAVVAALGVMLADPRALARDDHPLRLAAHRALSELVQVLPWDTLERSYASWHSRRLDWDDPLDEATVQRWMEMWVDPSDLAWRQSSGINALHDGALDETPRAAGYVVRHPGFGVGLAAGLGLTAVAALAWALWPIDVITRDERVALEMAGVTVVPPGQVACPATDAPLRESKSAAKVVGWHRAAALRKDGWQFLEPAEVAHVGAPL
jgi:hypothetical protein